jgi:zinc transport system substrate-binding protein
MISRTALGGVVLALGLATAACGSARASVPARPTVVTSFYPLRFVVERVVGDRMAVHDLTPAGTEPHDLELTTRQTAALSKAKLVVYLATLSPAVDDAVKLVASASRFDVASAARLDLVGDHGSDVHFWLDPTRLASVADAVSAKLTELDPAGASTYASNATTLRNDLERLDAEVAEGLSSCQSNTIVTSHDAFAYLARRYNLTQHGINGPFPDVEPTSRDIATAVQFVQANDVRTIYTESLVSAGSANAVAAETGAAVAELNPIETVTAEGADYLSMMRGNLAALRRGQVCV